MFIVKKNNKQNKNSNLPFSEEKSSNTALQATKHICEKKKDDDDVALYPMSPNYKATSCSL